jgi:hypothetical protein
MFGVMVQQLLAARPDADREVRYPTEIPLRFD